MLCLRAPILGAFVAASVAKPRGYALRTDATAAKRFSCA
jgi:hypothetical protein